MSTGDERACKAPGIMRRAKALQAAKEEVVQAAKQAAKAPCAEPPNDASQLDSMHCRVTAHVHVRAHLHTCMCMCMCIVIVWLRGLVCMRAMCHVRMRLRARLVCLGRSVHTWS